MPNKEDLNEQARELNGRFDHYAFLATYHSDAYIWRR